MITVVTVLQLYVFNRLGALTVRKRHLNRAGLIAVGLACWIVFVLSRVYRGQGAGIVSNALQVVGMQWVGCVFLAAVGFFIADLVSGFGLLFRRSLNRLRLVGAVFGVMSIILGHVQALRPPVVETYEVAVDALPDTLDGLTIAALADLHIGEALLGPGWLSARIDQAMDLRPDVIVLAGDLFERRVDPLEMVPVMQRLSAPLGVWAVRGNHDAVRSNRRDVTGEILAGAGIRLLANEWAQPVDGLVLAGVDDLTVARRRPGEGEANLDRALRGRPEGATILLSHTPWLTGRAAKAGVDLMLSGHTHNGQIWPFKHLVRVLYPLVEGMYERGGMNLIVSRGTGTWGPRLRLWVPGEISLVILRQKGPRNADASACNQAATAYSLKNGHSTAGS
ncbi:Metallophosphoesterase [uncultured Desulfatiglans sp.]|uniref:Metallophosphoesterase n=1 Tax=Uncultured Desulfatiglans sp. TaxID=1748965 RepID=A0A653A4M9_UNCDX|nr:Metallophosphoesterase [uncultured Desulfatiglans sp.]